MLIAGAKVNKKDGYCFHIFSMWSVLCLWGPGDMLPQEIFLMYTNHNNKSLPQICSKEKGQVKRKPESTDAITKGGDI